MYRYKLSWTTADGSRVTNQFYTADAVSKQLLALESWGAYAITVEQVADGSKVVQKSFNSRSLEKVADALNVACEGYLEQVETLNEEYDRIEFEAHYENRPHTKAERDRLAEIVETVARLEELNEQTLDAIEILRVASLER